MIYARSIGMQSTKVTKKMNGAICPRKTRKTRKVRNNLIFCSAGIPLLDNDLQHSIPFENFRAFRVFRGQCLTLIRGIIHER